MIATMTQGRMIDMARFLARLNDFIAEVDVAADAGASVERGTLLTAACYLQMAADTLAKAVEEPIVPDRPL